VKKGIILGIDRGASFTDFGVVADGRLIAGESLERRDWAIIGGTFERLCAAHGAGHMVFTGSAAGMPSTMKERAQIVSEIDAIGFGGAALARCRECLVVSAGTGTAIVHFKDGVAKHVGGTGVGGGTIKGLCTLICDMEDPNAIEEHALRGHSSKVNLTLAELGYDGLSFLGADVTASNFAALQSRRTEDLCAATLSLVGETIGIVASLCARELNCRERIVMVGKVSRNRYIRRTLELVGKLYQTTFLFPENPGYATVFGAAMKYAQAME
jgi:type II pantothenate kinase